MVKTTKKYIFILSIVLSENHVYGSNISGKVVIKINAKLQD